MHTQFYQIAQPHSGQDRKQHLLFRPVAQKPAGPTPDRRVTLTHPELWRATRHGPSPSRVAEGTTHLLEIAQDKFDNCGRQVQQCGDLAGSGLFEERHCFLDEPTEGILGRLAPSEDRSLVQDNVQRFGGDSHDQTARRPLDLFEQSLNDLPPFSSHFSPAPTSSPVPRHLQNPVATPCEREQRVEMIARLGLNAGNVGANAGLLH